MSSTNPIPNSSMSSTLPQVMDDKQQMYRVQGSSLFPTSTKDLVITEVIPSGNYAVQFNPLQGGFFLTQVDPTEESTKKKYGDVESRAERIFNTFLDRHRSTGVLLSGEKGSGKTMLARELSLMGYKHNMPTILVNTEFYGEAFNSFIASISQPCVLLFDEFEKIYDLNHQAELLTLFDGVFSHKKLFVLTVNDPYKIDRHMLNRPGRLYYRLNYTGLNAAFVEEYCKDNLRNQEKVKEVVDYTSIYDSFNFDMLQSLVEEMNRYGSGVVEALDWLNIDFRNDGSNRPYDFSISYRGVDIPTDEFAPTMFTHSPLRMPKIAFEVFPSDKTLEKCAEIQSKLTSDELGVDMAEFQVNTSSDLVKLNPADKSMVFKSGDFMIKSTPRVVEQFSYTAYMGL